MNGTEVEEPGRNIFEVCSRLARPSLTCHSLAVSMAVGTLGEERR
jgi:hypothetical protein